jgi:hypothetical protein
MRAVDQPKLDRIARLGRAILSLSGLFFALSLQGCGAGRFEPRPDDPPALEPPSVSDSPTLTNPDQNASDRILILKFVEGSDIRLREGKLVSISSGAVEELDEIFTRFPPVEIERLFTQPEEQIAKEQADMEAETGEDLPDLNLYFRVTVKSASDRGALMDALNSLPIVERAYPEAAPAPPPQRP